MIADDSGTKKTGKVYALEQDPAEPPTPACMVAEQGVEERMSPNRLERRKQEYGRVPWVGTGMVWGTQVVF